MTLQEEIDDLTSDILKKEYLEAIRYEDQSVRNDPKRKMNTQSTDASNLKKIEAYLAKYGYPAKELLGSKAAETPWLVIHHQPMKDGQEANIRRKHFSVIYQAYLDGHIPDGAVSFYLNRIYHAEKGKRFEIESPYMPQDELDQLMAALNLTPPN